MRSTRSNTIPSTCFIFGVPPEILQYMMSSMSTSSLVSLAVCCKRLRELASPILLRSVKVVTNRKENFIPLLRLATNAEKSSRLRHLSLVDGKPKNSIERDKAGSNNLASVLPTFINLTSLEIPFPFLSNDLFHLIYSHASITTLKICTPVERWRTNDLATRDRTPLPPRPLPLLVPELEVGLYIGKDDYYQLGNLLDFFNFHGVVVPEIKLHNHITGPAGAFGSAGSLPGRLESSIIVPHLTSLHVTITEDHCSTSLQWLASIFNTTQTSLQEVHLAVGKYDGFMLDRWKWRSNWSDALPALPTPHHPFFGSRISKYRAIITRNGVRDLVFEANQDMILRHDFITNLIVLAPTLVSLELGGGWIGHVFWPDLDSIVTALSSLPFLAHLTVKSGLTPSPTGRKVVACSTACYNRLKKDHLPLFQAAEVVGGYRAFWKVGIELNRARFSKLVAGTNVPSNGDGTTGQATVKLAIAERDRFIFGMEAVVELEGGVRVESIKETEGGILDASPEKWKAAVSCVVCEVSYFAAKIDPVASLMELPAAEVRAALEAGGFNFKKFVSKKKSSSATLDSFETFLRSAA